MTNEISTANHQKRPTVVCLTPIKNEAWILRRFLSCASLWADRIILADQNSSDQSREIASEYPKVILTDNPSNTFNEPERQKILIDAARRIPGPRLLITLDADEILTANFMNSPEWQTVLNAPVGTVIQFQWINLLPDFQSYWTPARDFPWGFMDDDSDHVGCQIHSPRIPIPSQAPTITLRDIKVLHYQYTNWDRMESKHRWYQCWERFNRPWRRPIEIYRQYHHMNSIPLDKIKPLPEEWLKGYKDKEIDVTSIYREPVFWWDREILNWLSKYGSKTFAREAIWDINWIELAQKTNFNNNSNFLDPRSPLEKYIHSWLSKTQYKSSKFSVRLIQKMLWLLGW